ncbi:MAG: ATP-binding protein [Gemmatimonadota bacterium]|nr:ATP-binding protein [Gemmatimonadota bacterium]
MRKNGKDHTDDRKRTDTSLDAERIGADAVTDEVRRRLDKLIELDRFLADDRLFKFREKADRLIELDRLAFPSASRGVEHERESADESIQAEREASDALLERERGRVDARSAAKRRELDEERDERKVQRDETNANLARERTGSDLSLAALERRHELLAIVTHDLRSPLTVIAANSTLLLEDTKEDATREAAEDILVAATRMGRLLEDLMDVARIESGTLRVTKDIHDIGALLSEVLHSYRPLFATRGIRFQVELPTVALPARFDHDRVVQLLSNLLSNALKFTPTGGVVELCAEDHEGEVVLAVRDSGPGIKPEELPHVFERFRNADEDPQRGLGLGLYICKSIAEAHGGSISVESTPGRGAEFRVALPRSEGTGENEMKTA